MVMTIAALQLLSIDIGFITSAHEITLVTIDSIDHHSANIPQQTRVMHL